MVGALGATGRASLQRKAAARTPVTIGVLTTTTSVYSTVATQHKDGKPKKRNCLFQHKTIISFSKIKNKILKF